VERFDLEGCKSPEGERKPGITQVRLTVDAATGQKLRFGRTPGQTGFRSRSRRAERATEAVSRYMKQQAGSFDSVMVFAKARVVTGE
jgi:hypothetical protein